MNLTTNQLRQIKNYVKKRFYNDTTGHDFYHLERVTTNAEIIVKQEKADYFLTIAAAWLHDIADHKLTNEPNRAIEDLKGFLISIDIPKSEIEKINIIINNNSFHLRKIPQTIEGKIVQDADRLDAMGAIGIARAFAYGGSKHRAIYNPVNDNPDTIKHFYEKLLHLKEGMHTKTGKDLATERHHYMEAFLKQFYREWNGLP